MERGIGRHIERGTHKQTGASRASQINYEGLVLTNPGQQQSQPLS